MTPRLVLCDGWRGVHRWVEQKLASQASRDPLTLRRVLVLVPTATARRLFTVLLESRFQERRSAIVLPAIMTMSDLIDRLADRSLGRVRRIDPLFREALLERALVEEPPSATAPPFAVRPGLVTPILAFYDRLCLAGHEPEAFAREALDELADPEDPGARRMMAQTLFLTEALERYRSQRAGSLFEDETTVRRALLERGPEVPYREVIALGPEAVSSADVTFFEKAPGVRTLEIAIPESMAGAGSIESLKGAARLGRVRADDRTFSPAMVRPAPKEAAEGQGGEELVFAARDREEVLTGVARFLKARQRLGVLPALERVGVVVPSPLPYLYLAKKIFEQSAIPFELQEDFPLASEPYVAAVDQVLELVDLEGRRSAALGLLRSPFFHFPRVTPADVAALDSELARWREPGGTRTWRRLLERLRRPPVQPRLPGMERLARSAALLGPLEALVDAGQKLAPLASEATTVTEKIRCLRRFLDRFSQPMEPAERHERSKHALVALLERLEQAARLTGDPAIPFHAFREKLHRAIESHTFSLRTGSGGVHLVDGRSAPYGDFDLVILVGLNEGEWPARSERNIFYPQWLLRRFGWPSDAAVLAHERARFAELLRLPRGAVALFRHHLDDEIPTVPSPFLEEASAATAGREERIGEDLLQRLVVSRADALRAGAVTAEPAGRERSPAGLVTRELPSLEPVSATAFEMYLRCPFKYYARYVLGLEEEEDFEAGMTPLERGRILHEILKEAFEIWDAREEGPRAVTPESYEEALALFRRIAQEKLPPETRGIELERLFGGPGQQGAIEWLLREEMARGPLQKRFLEQAFQSPLRLEQGPRGERPWFVRVKGRADRVDVDFEGGLHVLDYKSGKAPEARVTLQAPLYAMCLAPELAARPVEASYISLREHKAVARDDYQATADRVREIFRHVSEGRFPPRPYQDHLCHTCGYVVVCRKEIEEERTEEPGGELPR